MSAQTLNEQPVRSTWALGTPELTDYYDTEWGMPVFDESGVFLGFIGS